MRGEGNYFLKINGILFPKLFMSSVRKKNVLVTKKNSLKAEQLEQWKLRNNFWNRMIFWIYSYLFRSSTLKKCDCKVEKIGKNKNLETCKKS